jgi:hypothetical protein
MTDEELIVAMESLYILTSGDGETTSSYITCVAKIALDNGRSVSWAEKAIYEIDCKHWGNGTHFGPLEGTNLHELVSDAYAE